MSSYDGGPALLALRQPRPRDPSHDCLTAKLRKIIILGAPLSRHMLLHVVMTGQLADRLFRLHRP